VDKVAGLLEVGRSDDTNEIVIRLPDLRPDANGAICLVLAPRYARHLANLLIENAAHAEAETGNTLEQSKRNRLLNHNRELPGPK